MGAVYYKSYHVGHGAMHYFKICDAYGRIEKKILIDAGSNKVDAVESVEKSKKEVIDDIFVSGTENQCIFCLTHIHDDHYSFFSSFINELDANNHLDYVEKFYIGSCDQETLQDLIKNPPKKRKHAEFVKGMGLFDQSLRKLGCRVQFLINSNSGAESLLWKDEDGIELHVLFNCLYSGAVHEAGETLNDNSANFLLKNTKSKEVFWVTGDATGNTFNYLLRDGFSQSRISTLIHECKVNITVPHHGSMKSLVKGGFVVKGNWTTIKQLKSNGTNWTTLCDQIGLANYQLILISCYDDQYGHPDGAALYIYSELCRYRSINYDWIAYKQYDSEPNSLFRKMNVLGNCCLQRFQCAIASTITHSTGDYLISGNIFGKF